MLLISNAELLIFNKPFFLHAFPRFYSLPLSHSLGFYTRAEATASNEAASFGNTFPPLWFGRSRSGTKNGYLPSELPMSLSSPSFHSVHRYQLKSFPHKSTCLASSGLFGNGLSQPPSPLSEELSPSNQLPPQSHSLQRLPRRPNSDSPQQEQRRPTSRGRRRYFPHGCRPVRPAEDCNTVGSTRRVESCKGTM